jgi:hypothetical protein
VKYVYIAVICGCLGYIAKHFHWPYPVTFAAALLVFTLSFLVARLVEEDRR